MPQGDFEMCIVCVDCLYLSKAPLLYPSIVLGCGVEADLILCVEARISYRNGWNTEALIFETLKPVEITKELFEQHLNTLKKV